MTVGTGSLEIDNASQLKLTSLSLAGTSQLIVTANPALGTATNLNVVGAANIASGATIGVRLANVLAGSATYTIIQASQLTAGTVDASLLGATPFFYNTSLSTNTAAGTVSATLTRKTAAQLGLPTTSAGGYEPLIAVLAQDTGLEGALLAQTTQAGAITLYNQLMPNHSGALFNALATSVEAFGKPLDDRQDPVGGGFWMQETNSGLFADGRDNDPGYKAWSFGAVGGYELPRTPLGILGVTFGASTNEIYPDSTDSAADLHANLVDAGVYWRITKGGFSANARVGVDYARISSDRVIEILGGDGLAVTRSASGDWSGFGFNARGMASYEARFGNVYVRPLMSVDYMRLTEGAYTESGGGDVMDLAVGSRTSSRLSTFAGFAVGALYGPDRSWGPEALIGYKGVANEVLGVTTARFTGGGNPFQLTSDEISGAGAAVHLSVRGENGSGGFAVETGAEARDGLNIYDLRLTGHVQF
jgi:outer membrane autotransporter protein